MSTYLGTTAADTIDVSSDPIALIYGGLGDDTLLYAGAGHAFIFGGGDNDVIISGGGLGAGRSDWIAGGRGNDAVSSGAGSDFVMGNAGDDTLFGGTGADMLKGGTGADILWGGAGKDDLWGGQGADTFRFLEIGNANMDTIRDFRPGDVIRLANFHDFPIDGALSTDEFRIGKVAEDDGDRIIYNPSIGVLWFDSDGLGGEAQIRVARLSNRPAIDESDFLVS